MIYSAIFIFFIFTLFSTFENKNRASKIFIWFISISYILLIPILVGINTQRADFSNYLEHFFDSPFLFSGNIKNYIIYSHYEIGYGIFVVLLKSLINSATIFFIIYNYCGLKCRNSFYLSFCTKEDILILFFSFFVHEFLRKDCVQIRNGFASAIVLYSLYFLYKDKKKKFVFYVLIASSFQIAGIVALPLLMIKNEYSHKFYRLLKVVFILSLIISIFFPLRNILLFFNSIGLIPSRIAYYLLMSSYLVPMKFTNPLLLKQIVIVSYIFIAKKQSVKDSKIFFLFEVYTVSTIYYLLFRDFEIVAGRFGSLFYASEAPLLVLLIEKNKKYKNLKKCLLVFFYFALFLYNLLTFKKFLGWEPKFYFGG